MHVFSAPELKISMPGDVHYVAVRSTAGGAPFRSVTVRDTIGDLPPVENGASKPTIDVKFLPLISFYVNVSYLILIVLILFFSFAKIVW